MTNESRVGQPSVMGQLLAGILLGPSVLGLIWPDFQHALFPAATKHEGGGPRPQRRAAD